MNPIKAQIEKILRERADKKAPNRDCNYRENYYGDQVCKEGRKRG